MIRPHGFSRQGGVILTWGFLIIVTCLASAPAPAQSGVFPPTQGTVLNHAGGHHELSPNPGPGDTPLRETDELTPRQRSRIMRANFEMSKSDATELAALAKSLREELNKTNANILSFQVMNRLDRIEKLARRIRDETKGF